MLHSSLIRATRFLSSRFYYVVWTRGSMVTLLLLSIFGGGQSGTAVLGLIFTLTVLLLGGVLLLILAVKDFIR